MKQQRYAPHGTLALNPQAFGLVFDLPEIAPVEVTANGVAVVQIRGPLMHHADFFFDSYEAIKVRVAEALAAVEGTGFVLLSIDSPGGLVSGAFDTARELRTMAAAAGVDLYAHVGAQATSAAYALASSAMWIGVSESAQLGSIGVIDTMIDVTAQNAARGLAVELVTSGARKADGNPNSAISDGARLAVQGRVDDLAAMFFELVSDHGWGGNPEAIRELEAGIVHGGDAVRLGLATEIATLDQSIAFASPESMRTGTGATATEQGKYNMAKATTEEDAVASLRKMAESDDDDEARKARAALKALGADDDESAEGDDDDDAKGEGDDDAKGEGDDDDDEAKSKAEGDDDEAKAEGDDDEAKAEDEPDAKGASAVALQALSEIHELKAERRREKQSAERATLIASRPDFAPELVEVLRTAPMSMVRKTVKTLKRGAARADRVAAAAAATGTRGEGQGGGNAPRLAPAESAALSMAMGLTEMHAETVHTPNKMSFGVHKPIAQKGK